MTGRLNDALAMIVHSESTGLNRKRTALLTRVKRLALAGAAVLLLPSVAAAAGSSGNSRCVSSLQEPPAATLVLDAEGEGVIRAAGGEVKMWALPFAATFAAAADEAAMEDAPVGRVVSPTEMRISGRWGPSLGCVFAVGRDDGWVSVSIRRRMPGEDPVAEADIRLPEAEAAEKAEGPAP